MSDMDEGDSPYAGLFCKGCGLCSAEGETACIKCGLPFPENLVERYPYSGKPEPWWRARPRFVPPAPKPPGQLRLAFVGGSLRGDIERNTEILEDLVAEAEEAEFLPMCFARASLTNLKVWENKPDELEAAQMLVDGIVEHVAKTGGAFFVRQRDDGTFSEGTKRELRIFIEAAKHAARLGLAPEIHVWKTGLEDVLIRVSTHIAVDFILEG